MKSTASSFTVHRLIGSKDAVNLMHRCAYGIAYTDVRLLNNLWADEVSRTSRSDLPVVFEKGKPLHISIDNPDGRQETLTGAGTTLFTNRTVYPSKKNKRPYIASK